MLSFVLIALISYLIGSIPSGYLIARLADVDIRQQGSGNIGATNVTRVLGKRFGYPVFLADFCKGITAVLSAPYLGHLLATAPSMPDAFKIVAGIFVVIGNAFPVWLRFRGGKGVATSSGLLFGLMPAAALACVAVWVVAFFTTRYVSLASVIAALSLPIAVFVINHVTDQPRTLVLWVTIGLAAIVILRHRSNISRLLRGTEQRFQRREN